MARTTTRHYTKKPGRPVVYQSAEEYPQTISVRLPRDLYTRVQHYAWLHRQSISELVKDGLEWRLTDGDPRAQTVHDLSYYYNTVLQQLPRAEDLAPRVPTEPPAEDNRNTVLQETVRPAPGPEAVMRQPAIPAFDATKHVLGALCRQGHEFEGRGQSLRNLKGNECVRCVADRQARSKARKRQAQPV